MIRAHFILGLWAAISFADGTLVVERKDWVADWDRYVDRVTTTAEGRVIKYRAPAQNARREIMLRVDFESQVAGGWRKANSVGIKALELVSSSALKISPLEVVDLAVDDTLIRSLEVTGEAVLAFWTLPRIVYRADGQKRTSSLLYLQGRHSGHSTVRMKLSDGSTRLLQVDVP